MLAKQIEGSKFVEMKGLGHFPMAENFTVFKEYLMPILDEIAMNAKAGRNNDQFFDLSTQIDPSPTKLAQREQ